KPKTSPFCRSSSSALTANSSPYFIVRSWASITRRTPRKMLFQPAASVLQQSSDNGSWRRRVVHREYETIIRPMRPRGFERALVALELGARRGAASNEHGPPVSHEASEIDKMLIVIGQVRVFFTT